MFFFRKLTPEEKLFSNHLQKILGFKPKNLSIYRKALTHSSVIKKNINNNQNNERLEFIGDAIITLIVTEFLFEKFPNANEGELTVLRASIVNRKMLNKIASEYRLAKILSFKNNNTYFHANNMLGNSFEALVGAIYFDRGYKFATKFIKNTISVFFPNLEEKYNGNNYKSLLLIYSQKNKYKLEFSTFENIEENEKIQHFLCEICLEGKFIATGKGWSKKDAEQIAAKKAYEIIMTGDMHNCASVINKDVNTLRF
ncbi:MAG: ribonuclease III [Bacteroidales bacterium]|jgi:ribonuclease-3|nr:ribonuclease III [Bacteroidales bacterium]